MPADFDLPALREALDRRRAELGFSWTAVGTELGISPSTLSGLGTRPVTEGDGVFRAAAWLGRTPESFVPGFAGASAWHPLPAPAGALRFDAPALYSALEAKRLGRRLTWRQVAAESGVRSHVLPSPRRDAMPPRQGGPLVEGPPATRRREAPGPPVARGRPGHGRRQQERRRSLEAPEGSRTKKGAGAYETGPGHAPSSAGTFHPESPRSPSG